MTNSDEISVTEMAFLNAIDKAIIDAASLLEGADLPWEAEDDEFYSTFEERHHCGTCMVRVVMETVWPAIDDYIEWLKSPGLTEG